jgi:D-threonate/D-erythronate kinase
MTKRCLIIADDLTGGADTGAQFVKWGIRTFLVSCEKNLSIDFSKFARQDALVVNTDSRGLSPEKASSLVSTLFKRYDPALFPVIYKKIDSTLRGNIGYEIDALIEKTNAPLCFMTPAYPEQGRTVVDGVLMISGKPLASTEVSRDASFSVKESRIRKLVELQTRHPVGWIGLEEVHSAGEKLLNRIEAERKTGNRIIVLDAVSRQDLKNIADVAFRMERMPLFVGSAGLAREVARKLSPSISASSETSAKRATPVRHIFVVSCSASSVTHEQLRKVEADNIPAFVLPQEWIIREDPASETERKDFSREIAHALSEGSALLKAPSEYIQKERMGLPAQPGITGALASLALSALEQSGIRADDLALILTGGETAMSIIRLLQAEGIEIEDELLEGIMKGRLKGGRWNGLTTVTKAGGFGKDDAFKNIVEILKKG